MGSADTFEEEKVVVDREYLWALEVLAVGVSEDNDVTRSEYQEARQIVEDANLRRPRDRHKT